jgi:polysaccharide biosynthesis/export protein
VSPQRSLSLPLISSIVGRLDGSSEKNGKAIRWRSYVLSQIMMSLQNLYRYRIVLLSWILFVAGCNAVPDTQVQTPKAAPTTPMAGDINRALAALAKQSNAASMDYQIGPEDLLEITLFNIPEASGTERHLTPRITTVRVSQKGQISLPLIGQQTVMGITLSTLEDNLRVAYDKYIHNPEVGVLVKEYRQRASVLGAVQKPGVFELTGPKTVIDLLAMAGGINEKAGSQVHIYRNGVNGRETHVLDLAVLANNVGLLNAENASMFNLAVQPGDTINIPEAGMFFVDGAVRKPGSYPLGRRYSLSQALATAGGVDVELYSSAISILRRNGAGDVETIVIDLDDVVSGAAADPQLQPDDVVIVPTSTGKFFVKRFIGTLVGGFSMGSFIR